MTDPALFYASPVQPTGMLFDVDPYPCRSCAFEAGVEACLQVQYGLTPGWPLHSGRLPTAAGMGVGLRCPRWEQKTETNPER